VTLLSIILWRSREILDRRSAAGARPVSALEQDAKKKKSLVATAPWDRLPGVSILAS